MNTGLRITAFAAALAATFGTAYGVGKGLEPVVVDSPPASHDKKHSDTPPARHGGGDHSEHAGTPPGGPQTSRYGHLVALRSGGLAHRHVHANGDPGDGTTEPQADHEH